LVQTFAGGGGELPVSDGVEATKAAFVLPWGVALSPAGTALYVSDALRNLVWKIANPQPFGEEEIVVPALDGSVIDVFDGDGDHLRTEDATTRRTLWSFRYQDYPAADPEQPPRHLVTEIEDAFGNVVTVARGGDGAPLSITSPFGQTTQLVVDPVTGYLQQLSRPGAAGIETVQPSHRADGLLDALRDPNGGLYTYQWSADGRLERIDDPANGSLRLDETGDALSRTVTLTSTLGRVASQQVEFSRVAGSLDTASTETDGLVAHGSAGLDGAFSWDTPEGLTGSGDTRRDPVFGPLARDLVGSSAATPGGVTAALSHATESLATDPSDPLRTLYRTDAVTLNGRTARATYDAGAATVTSTSPEGRASTGHLDAYGRVTQVDVPGIEPARWFYDARGRLERVEQGTGAELRQTIYSYSPTTGFLDSVTDTLGRTVTFKRDEVGRVKKQILPDLREIGFAYDLNGNVTGVTPPTRPRHDFRYTPIDQVESYTPPDAGFTPRATTFGYNDDGQLTSITRPDGQQIVYAYEPGTGRLDTVTLPTGVLDVAYDAQGRPASVAAPSGAVTSWGYDGPMVRTVTQSGPVAGSVSIEPNAQLEVGATELAGAPWTRVQFGYDGDGLLTSAGALALVHDPANGLLTDTTLGTVTDHRTFTPFGELDVYTASITASPTYSFDFDRDTAGRITKKTETVDGVTSVWEYAYDPDRGWLTEVKKDGAVVESYGYDGNGNRTSWSDFWGSGSGVVYDDQDRLLTAGTVSYTYTKNGELLTRTEGSDTTTYAYDVVGSLLEVGLPTGVVVEYLTDAAGHRIGKKVDGTLVRGWIYAGGLSPIAETDGTGTITTRYVYGTRINVPELMVREGVTYRFVTDHLGSVRMVIDAASGAIAQQIDYDAWGRVIFDSNPGFQPFGFAGGLYEPETGLVRFGARDYDPEVGRWTSKDPVGFGGGTSCIYQYAGNDPLDWKDPTGMWWLPWETLDYWSYQQSSKEFSVALASFWEKPSWKGALWVTTSLITSMGDGLALAMPVVPAVGGISHAGIATARRALVEAEEAAGSLERLVYHGHHSDPMFLGGARGQKLTRMLKSDHYSLHADLNRHLVTIVDDFGNHMRPQRGNPGALIRDNFSRDEMLRALADFYRRHLSKYPEAALDFFAQHPDYL